MNKHSSEQFDHGDQLVIEQFTGAKVGDAVGTGVGAKVGGVGVGVVGGGLCWNQRINQHLFLFFFFKRMSIVTRKSTIWKSKVFTELDRENCLTTKQLAKMFVDSAEGKMKIRF